MTSPLRPPHGAAGRILPQESPAGSWRDRLSALRYIPALLALVWRTHRGFALAMVVLRAVRAFVPLSALWVGKLIIDTVVRAREGADDWDRLWRLVLIELAIVVAGEVLARTSSLVESLLGDLFANSVSVKLMEHAATLDLAQFEDPAFYDHLERARRQTVGRLGLVTQLLAILQDVITLLTLGAALIAYSPWLLLLLVVAILPSFWGETHFAALGYSLLFQWTPERRQLDYLRFVGASDRTAKEVQMFALAPWLIERYRVLSQRFFEENRRLSVRKGIVSALLSILGTLGYYGAYAIMLLRAVRGMITIGDLTFLAASFARGRDLIQRLLMAAGEIYEQSLYLRDLFLFLEMEPTIAAPSGAPSVPVPIREGFVFEDVGFKYPGGDRWAVRHVSFHLGAGERIALVGENGAGKTTLTKLIARLYDPTEGRILLDGRDLREYDVASVRRSIGVIFQDFVRYDMRFDENIGVGEIEQAKEYLASAPVRVRADTRDARMRPVAAVPTETQVNGSPTRVGGNGDSPEPPAVLREAAERSLAASLLPRLPDGYRQMLGRRFEGGVDLSGGEWQKVALARAYLREAQLLILDEPTAALDARAEWEVFVRFNELMAGRMAMVISHRFSTVRMADRIIVLKDGEIVEDGTHQALVSRGGLYAELFQMQAAGYR